MLRGQNPVNGMLKQKLDSSLQTKWLKETKELSYQMHHPRAERQDVLIGRDCSTHPMLSPSLSTEHSQFPALDVVPFLLGCLFFISSVIPYNHISCYCCLTVSVPCLSISSPVSTTSLSNDINVILPFFFRLWFRWHLPCAAVIAKCRLGRWDIGQPLPLLPFDPSLPFIWHGHPAVCA